MRRTSLIRQKLWPVVLLILLAAGFRLCIARFFPNDTPEDGRVYAQMARNLLEQHVYSHSIGPPYQPSIIRLPGYPIFLAALYSVFGHTNNTAVRIAEALLDTASCALIALIAYYWEPDQKRKYASAIAALALAVVCPFTTIYVATILAETPTVFLALAICLLATLAFRASFSRASLWWWGATGLVAGIAVFLRPDSGLFAGAVGLTLVVTTLLRGKTAVESGGSAPKARGRVFRVLAQGTVLSAAFALVLVPWTVRNWHEFHILMPLAPTHGQMPGEFVPSGYYAWIRTWLDDRRYIEPMLWSLDEAPIDLDDLPDRAFDSAEEKARVGQLLDQYNDPLQEDESAQTTPTVATPTPTPTPTELSKKTASPAGLQPSPAPEPDDQDKKDQGDETNDQAAQNQAEQQKPEMTPAIDAAFAQIASERRRRAPLRYYFYLPLKRAGSQWFGPHADYYPFTGELFPLSDLDHHTHQQIWLPLFLALVWLYTLLGVAGGWRLWRARDFAARRWLLLVTLLIFTRLAFFSTMENPEPRYTVEIFPFLSVLGGIAIARVSAWFSA